MLLDADHPAHAGATACWMGSLAEVLQRIPGSYRSGAGLPCPDDGADCRLAIVFEALHGMARPVEALAANGTALRPDTVRGWAGRAGFAGYQVLPVDNVFWRFYQLTG